MGQRRRQRRFFRIFSSVSKRNLLGMGSGGTERTAKSRRVSRLASLACASGARAVHVKCFLPYFRASQKK